jgi:hypothetical protein
MKRFIAVCLLAFSTLSLSTFASDKLEAHGAWVREAPPSAKILAAYMMLHNNSHQARTLDHISSPNFDRVEIHRTEMHDGMAHMVKVSQLVIGAKDKVAFEPGGLHAMLIEPKKALKAGDKVQLTLHFKDNSTLDITAPVKNGQGMEDRSNHDMHEMKHDDHNMHDNGHEKKKEHHDMNSGHHGH